MRVIRMIRGSLLSLSSCLFVLIRGFLPENFSPKGNFSREEQLLFHAYSQNPLGRLELKDQGASPTRKRGLCFTRCSRTTTLGAS
jgi:hypothetical protein